MNRSGGKFVLTSGGAPAMGAATMRLMAQAGTRFVATGETCFVTRSIRLVDGALTGQ